MAEDMHVNPQRAKVLIENLGHVAKSIQAVNKTGREVSRPFSSLLI